MKSSTKNIVSGQNLNDKETENTIETLMKIKETLVDALTEIGKVIERQQHINNGNSENNSIDDKEKNSYNNKKIKDENIFENNMNIVL